MINFYRISIWANIVDTKQRVEWRLMNSHNMTYIQSPIRSLSLVTVGNASYGPINVESFDNPEEKLTIGSYVSIAGNVVFILGGNHQVNSFSTYPIKSHFMSRCPIDDAQTKGHIVVEDEVWIGSNVIVLSGVTLGKGAIIAAGSVVTKSVEPFSIYGGNPAKFIKYRIPEELIEERSTVDINTFSFDKLNPQDMGLFYQPLDREILHQIKNLKY